MKRIVLSTIALFASLVIWSQEMPISYESSIEQDSVSMTCLYKTNQFVSINLVQMMLGTISINYEYCYNNDFGVRLGVGKTLGYRIKTEEYDATKLGGFFGTIEAKFYFPKSKYNCYMQTGIALGYKYWNYNKRELTSISETESITVSIPTTENVSSVSWFAKHPVNKSITFEYQLGLGIGSNSNISKTFVTPNVGIHLGYIFK